MSNSFKIFLKVLSTIVAVGCIVTSVIPLISNSILTIGLGLISNPWSQHYVIIYTSVILVGCLLYVLVKLFKTNYPRKVVMFTVTIFLLITIFYGVLNVLI